MSLPSQFESLIAVAIDKFCFTGSFLDRSHVAKHGMEMLAVVPVDELGEPNASMKNTGENLGVTNCVLQGFVPRFDECVVVATPRAGIAP